MRVFNIIVNFLFWNGPISALWLFRADATYAFQLCFGAVPLMLHWLLCERVFVFFDVYIFYMCACCWSSMYLDDKILLIRYENILVSN
jgi:hypothetical protein